MLKVMAHEKFRLPQKYILACPNLELVKESREQLACSACSFCCRCYIPIILLHFVFLQGHGRISSAQVCPNADLCRNHSTLHTTAPHISGSACSICRVAQVRTWHVLTCLLVRTCLCVVSCTYLGLYLWQAVSAYASEQWAV